MFGFYTGRNWDENMPINRYCDFCGWESPVWYLHIYRKGKTRTVGYMCQVCGKLHPIMFPRLFLFRQDAMMVKENIRLITEYQPKVQTKITKSDT